MIIRRLAANAALVATSIVVGLVALEFGLRWYDGRPLVPDRNLILERAFVTNRFPVNLHHPVLGWVHRPNLSYDPLDPDRSVTTGEFGIRMSSAQIKPVPHGAILAVGDSYTEGSLVGDSQSWPAAAERLLETPIINAGLGGYGADQIVLMAEELIPRFRPKQLIVAFLDNDIERTRFTLFGGGPKPYFLVADNKLVPKNIPVPTAIPVGDAGAVGWARMVFGYSYLVDQVAVRLGLRSWYEVGPSNVIDTDPIMISCLLLDRIKQFADDHEVKLLFVMIYGPNSFVIADHRQEQPIKVLAHARALGIPTLDLWDAYATVKAEDPTKWRAFYLTEAGQPGHMSALGNAFAATLIADAVKPSTASARQK